MQCDGGQWLISEYSLSRHPGARGLYKVRSSLVYETGAGMMIGVRPGWYTDGASVPLLLRWWAPPFAGPYTAAAIVHDILYRAQHPDIDRARADRVLLQAMCASGVNRAQAAMIYAGVRIGGWVSWRENRGMARLYQNYLYVESRGDQ